VVQSAWIEAMTEHAAMARLRELTPWTAQAECDAITTDGTTINQIPADIIVGKSYIII
jgi:hypothetical protein